MQSKWLTRMWDRSPEKLLILGIFLLGFAASLAVTIWGIGREFSQNQFGRLGILVPALVLELAAFVFAFARNLFGFRNEDFVEAMENLTTGAMEAVAEAQALAHKYAEKVGEDLTKEILAGLDEWGPVAPGRGDVHDLIGDAGRGAFRGLQMLKDAIKHEDVDVLRSMTNGLSSIDLALGRIRHGNIAPKIIKTADGKVEFEAIAGEPGHFNIPTKARRYLNMGDNEDVAVEVEAVNKTQVSWKGVLRMSFAKVGNDELAKIVQRGNIVRAIASRPPQPSPAVSSAPPAPTSAGSSNA